MLKIIVALTGILLLSAFTPAHKDRVFLDLGEGFVLQFESVETDEAGALYEKMTLSRHQELIFRDDLNAFQIRGDYPQLLIRKQGYEILLQTKVSPYLSNLLLLQIKGNKVTMAKRLPIPLWPLQNIDEDEWKEGFGFLEEYEEIDSISVSYSPVIAWQSSDSAISIDTLSSMKLTKMVFGQYNGLEPNPKLVCHCKERVTAQLTHLMSLKTN